MAAEDGLLETGQPRGSAKLAGVLLHGRGRTPEEMIELANKLGPEEDVRWVAPRAKSGRLVSTPLHARAGLERRPQLSPALSRFATRW